MIIQLNDDYFVILTDEFENIKKEYKDDWVKLSEWIEHNGVFISGQDYFIMDRKEVEAVWKEFRNTFISHENELCGQVFTRIMNVLEEKKDVRQS